MRLNTIILLALSLLLATSCNLFKGKKKSGSSTTGWAYNDPDNGGFEYRSGYRQNIGPGLVYVQGGTFSMGRVEQDVMYETNNIPRRVTVASFYMDETEVRNVDWREYLYWLQRVYPNNQEVKKAATPDTLVWRDELSYNEPYLENYFRHAAYAEYPVVGISWVQANNYCKWRTDRVNERILIEEKILSEDLAQEGQNVFTADSYLNGAYDGTEGSKPMEDLSKDGGTRRVNISDGIVLPRYRLATEAEWEFAALALVGNTEEEVVTDRKIYPWNGNQVRQSAKKDRGTMMANNVRGRGDYMGTASALNDAYEITAPVKSFMPNDVGLFNMAGNVNEWVQDVYRPTSFQEFNEFQPLRGNVYTNFRRDASGNLMKDQYGELIRDTTANYINYRDGDYQSRIEESEEWENEQNKSKTTEDMYQPGMGKSNPRISDHSRVYKGGSWKDRTYWLGPGTRRYLDERKASNDLGFRCAMTHLGDSNQE